jgi:hypothetical protein
MATLADIQAKMRAVIGANSAGPVDKFRLLELLDLLSGQTAGGSGLAYQTPIVAAATPGTDLTVTGFVRVTAFTVDANDWINLPPGKAGMSIWGWSVPAHEIRTPASSGETINGVDSDGTQEAAIPATTLWNVFCVTDGAWILRAWTELGAPITAIVPD